MAKQKTARKTAGLARSYPYYLANAAVAANTDLEVRDKYSGKVATRVAMGDAAAIRKAIVAAQIYVTDLSVKKEMDAAWTGFFGDDMPTRATVGVADLGGGAIIEVVVTASRG